MFLPGRKWRIDIAFPMERLAIECEGVAPRGKAGRHQLTQHLHGNCEKHSAIAAAGWRLIRVTGVQIHLGYALRWIEAALKTPSDPDGPIWQWAYAVDAFAIVTDWGLDKVRAARRARRRNTTVFMTLAERKGGATT